MTEGEWYYETLWRDGTSIGAPMQRVRCDDYATALIEYREHADNPWHTAYGILRVEVVKGTEHEDG